MSEWTEQEGIEHGELKRKAYYTNDGIDGLNKEDLKRFCELNNKLATIRIRTKTEISDIKSGKADKMAGYYDKWYRYCRFDHGAAYDKGFNSVTCDKVEGCQIIECCRNL